jgi:hypothetical protein
MFYDIQSIGSEVIRERQLCTHMGMCQHIVTRYSGASLATRQCEYVGCYFIGDVGRSTSLLHMQQCKCEETFSIVTRLQWVEKEVGRRGQ